MKETVHAVFAYLIYLVLNTSAAATVDVQLAVVLCTPDGKG